MNIKAHHQSNVPEPAPTAPTPIPGEVVPVAEAEEARGFDWNGYLIRVIMNHSEPWFVLSDLSKALGLSRKPAATAERLDPDGVRQTYTIDSLGRKRQVTVIDESAMYQLVIRSDKPEAKEFQRWITREVLPQIRRTGMYLPTTSADPYSVMRAMLDQLESVDRKAAEAKEIAVRAGERTDLVEARVDLIMGGHGWRTALAFAKDHSLDTSGVRLSRLGSVAARLARADGIKPEPVPNVRYGVVNSMPEEYWMAAAKQIGLVAQPDAQAG